MKLSAITLVTASVLLSGAAATPFDSSEVCWRSCFHHRQNCPRHWYAKKIGKCWTCCQEHKSDYYEYDYDYDYEPFEWE
ncbi:hypothetical protein BDV27DRAFT_154532 [Aspergillus caelatus]|uniref:Uncharacterized protein n=1 Tax=Aspergillus caelatus TaxID=61420 RepID=A0A5N7ADG7_9EURO|nr:uncharacterized protein BDV27DRAFT_154532 [Aspergillus caelatus]KAE8367911.1 hypothetical protein BDV27DRAFT_154532 [Aspergillus caelatus]